MYADMLDTIGFVAESDPQVARAMQGELCRQRQNIEPIASENVVSPAVLAAMGSVLTNKYAEGYPRPPPYGGCAWVDEVENIARERACRLFGAQHANVQPHWAHRPTWLCTCAFECGRYRAGHGPFERRPPHARQPREHERQKLPLCALWRG